MPTPRRGHSHYHPTTLSISVRRLLFLFWGEGSRKLDEKGTQMPAVSQEVRGAAAAGEQKSDRREISFGRVASLAREDEIVAPIVGRLAAPWSYVIERHQDCRESLAAVGADGSVLLEEPSSRFRISYATRRMRCQLDRAVRCASFGALLSATRSATPTGSRALRVFRFGVRLVMPGMPAMIRRRRMRGDLITGSVMMLLMRRTAQWSSGMLWPFVAIGRIVKLS